MDRTAPTTLRSGRVLAGRLIRVGALAALLSASANAILLASASSISGAVVIPPDETVTLGQVAGASVAGSIGAAVIFAVLGRFTRRPVRVFCGVAAVGLLLSFVPIAVVGATGWSAGALALMHVVAAVINVGLLTRSGRREEGALG
jgi:hypothetical protein